MADRTQSPFSADRPDQPREPAVSVYRYVLDAFPRLGRAPSLEETARDLGLSEETITDALQELESHKAVRVDPSTLSIADAYPYSPRTTRHQVVLASGTRVYCTCAIDCFYVPFLTDSNVTIHSSCHHCGGGIDVRVVGRCAVGVTPPTTVVWDSAASYDCPKTSSFCNEAHVGAWKTAEPDEPGSIRSIDEATGAAVRRHGSSRF